MERALLLLFLLAARAAADCSNPPHLKDGSPTDEFPSSTSFPVGTRIFYSCNLGYVLQEGSSAVITCNKNSTWSSMETICEKMDCGEPDQIEHGFYETTSSTFGSLVVYHCVKGYKMTGRSLGLCSSRGWTGHSPNCKEHSTRQIFTELIGLGHHLITKEESIIKLYYHLLENERELLRMKETLIKKAEKYVDEYDF
ncbi:complement component receptor 1-like protein [Narcine bancroftii]|uniref:complement component receptor 1-like protein n=1 Tax=Narcine bancroftii TaxID=1343680 RepID=UPI003831A85C